MTLSSRARAGLAYALLAVTSVIMLLPFAWVVSGSLKSQAEFFANPGGWIPREATFENYVVLFRDKGFLAYFANSGTIVVFVVLANMLFGAMAGYALVHLQFRGKSVVFICVMAAMAVPYVVVFVPQFLIIVQLHLVDSLLGIMLPILVAPISVFIMRQFASSVPAELMEAARIDGASEPKIFFRVFLPLCGAPLATVGILSFLLAWNSFLWPLIVAQSEKTYTLPVGLAAASQASNTLDFGVLLAGAMVILLPVLILFLTMQRHFVQGIAGTGLKG